MVPAGFGKRAVGIIEADIARSMTGIAEKQKEAEVSGT